MRLLPVEKYADILLRDVRMLAEGSETFSEPVKLLYVRLGRKVQDRYAPLTIHPEWNKIVMDCDPRSFSYV